MRKIYGLSFIVALFSIMTAFFRQPDNKSLYAGGYQQKMLSFQTGLHRLLDSVENASLDTDAGKDMLRSQINEMRVTMKGLDFWLRYLEPTVYKKINGPLPVEWETEVFEKFEKPYKREGAGITLAALYLDEDQIEKDSLVQLVKSALTATQTYVADSITSNLHSYQHFFLCNRLFLLNLASIYTTGFECPDTSRIIPELQVLLGEVGHIYEMFNESFSSTALTPAYLTLYKRAVDFLEQQPGEYSNFDHFTFIRDYVNPLYSINQQLINQYKVVTSSFVDYSLNKKNTSIFNKDLYRGQNAKGIYMRVEDETVLAEISRVGKLLFYDPILSGNNKRSCASCHQPTEYFTDTSGRSSLQFNKKDALPRNTPSLLNTTYNHLIMLDGKHISLQDQTTAVITEPTEMGGQEAAILKKVLSCAEYKKTFTKLLDYTPTEDEITLEHITSAITLYYNKFSDSYSSFDNAMNKTEALPADVKQGFNLFMSKSQCATCHFVPQFNGVKPPFVGSEFEVLGVPADTAFTSVSADKGRYDVNPAKETLHAFRTGSLRNIQFTGPYMHNGVFKTLEQVVDFYDAGGGAGRGLDVSNQTLSSDSLHLKKEQKQLIIRFLQSLTEKIPFEKPPLSLPKSNIPSLAVRKVGGEY
jgi:cytochrome c peroxidase